MNKLDREDQLHIPVLLKEVLAVLQPMPGDAYLDVTAGYGGHAAAILAKTKAWDRATLVDRDSSAIEALRERFRQKDVQIVYNDFYSASLELKKQRKTFNMILADLGMSSSHLNIASRGFSFSLEGPLDMRMDQKQALTAEEVINHFSEDELAGLIKRFGEEPKASQIAKSIVQHRPIKTTSQLAQIVARAWPGNSKIHPATRTFQAIRIAVNNELEQLQRSLPIWYDLLQPEGRLAIISFHSLEDRLVKQMFNENSGDTFDATLRLLTKKPIVSGTKELAINPRARSAKLRAVAKIKKQEGVALYADSG